MADWSAQQYLKFRDERTRPARDLLTQMPVERAHLVFDLGCGPGNSTDLLVTRYPHAEVIGVDSSTDMLARARERLPRCKFVHADITTWQPANGADVLFSNGAFQWVPDLRVPGLSSNGSRGRHRSLFLRRRIIRSPRRRARAASVAPPGQAPWRS